MFLTISVGVDLGQLWVISFCTASIRLVTISLVLDDSVLLGRLKSFTRAQHWKKDFLFYKTRMNRTSEAAPTVRPGPPGRSSLV